MIPGSLTESGQLTSTVPKFVATTVEQKVRKLEYIKMEHIMEVIPPSPPSLDPSDADSSKKTGKSKSAPRAGETRKTQGSTSPNIPD